ncbi:MAG: LysR family transcriptional regulator [Oscillospiraceae bacterium]|jgi:DNA-binding transcriptional LysR family regulator|nr:LysR family transcriptional regulator [Oscillospiraceae bacterium]
MELKQLVDFVAVVDHGTLTAAAKALHLSQPPLSVQIHLLEQELGCTLFDRSTRRMQLTEAGRMLYERAAVILDQCASAQREMADYLSGGTAILRVGAVSSVCSTLFLTWMTAFYKENPGIHFEVQEGNTYQLLEAVRSGQSELAFVRTPFSAADLACTRLCSEPLCAVAKAEMLPQETIRFAALSQKQLLLTRRWENILRDAFHREKLEPHIFCLVDDTRTVLRMAEEGLGVGIVPQSVLPASGDCRVQSAVLCPKMYSKICAVNRRSLYLSAAAQKFLAVAKAAEK